MKKLIAGAVIFFAAGISEAAFIPSINVSTANYTFIGMGRNRIINGGMRIDQRNEGTNCVSLSSSGLTNWPVDHWVLISTQARLSAVRQSSATPTGFTHFVQVFTTSATVATSTMTSFMAQTIEGQYVADLGWGSAGAKTVNLSFYIKASTAGTFGGVLTNSGRTRSYPFTYSVSVSSTWALKSISIPGDTTGNWQTDNSPGIAVLFDLGSGSALRGTASAWASSNVVGASGTGAPSAMLNSSWSITGVQLEISSAATNFELRPDPIELQLCMRYYQKTFRAGTKPLAGATNAGALNYSVVTAGANSRDFMWEYFVPMRAAGTSTFYSPGESTSNWWNATDGAASGASSTVSTYNSEYRRTIRNVQAAGDGAGESVAIHATIDAESGF